MRGLQSSEGSDRPGMAAILALWLVLATISAWGSAQFARRDPRSTSFAKIGCAASMLVAYGAAFVLLEANLLDKGLLAYGVLAFVWLMTAGGAALCIGSLFGAAIGMYRSTWTAR